MVQRKIACARRDSISGKACLAEDVFHFVEDRGITVGRVVFDFEGGAKLLDQFALFAGELGWREHANVIVQVASAPTARIRQAFAFNAKYRAALRTFGDLQFLFPV